MKMKKWFCLAVGVFCVATAILPSPSWPYWLNLILGLNGLANGVVAGWIFSERQGATK